MIIGYIYDSSLLRARQLGSEIREISFQVFGANPRNIVPHKRQRIYTVPLILPDSKDYFNSSHNHLGLTW